MRTENDLRIALQHEADQAPEVAQALIRRAMAGQPRRSPVRNRLSVAVAMTIVAALIAAPFAIKRLTTTSNVTRPNPATPSPHRLSEPALSWVTVSNDHYTFDRSMSVGSNQEFIQIEGTFYDEWALVDFAPGSFDTSLVAHATSTVVDGHPGYFAKATVQPPYPRYLTLLMSPLVNGSFAGGHGYFSTIAWQLAPDHWVMLDRYQTAASLGGPTTWSASEPELLAFAATLHLKVRTEPVRQPFRVGYLPGTGWQLKSMEVFTDHQPSRGSRAQAMLVRGNLTVQIGIFPNLPGSLDPYSHRDVGNYRIEVNRDAEESHRSPLDAATTKRILDSITLAAHPETENDSWFPVSALLP